jgi:hypothetical protein
MELAENARRRTITPRAGRALKILAHAIEYLSDESMQRIAGGSRTANDRAGAEAIEILMRCNREAYFSFRKRRTAWKSIQRVLHLHFPRHH